MSHDGHNRHARNNRKAVGSGIFSAGLNHKVVALLEWLQDFSLQVLIFIFTIFHVPLVSAAV
jgi:hypothetical protein